jgi:hypothetical protein
LARHDVVTHAFGCYLSTEFRVAGSVQGVIECAPCQYGCDEADENFNDENGDDRDQYTLAPVGARYFANDSFTLTF